jgi:hypothetical protein
MAPAAYRERLRAFIGVFRRKVSRCTLLKNENRDLVLTHANNQLSTWRLVEISNFPTDQSKRSILQFRQIESERDLPLKPRLHGVAVSRNNVDRIRTRQRSYMKVRQLAEQFPVAPSVVEDREINSANNYEESECSKRRNPQPSPYRPSPRSDACLDSFPKGLIRDIPLARNLKCAFHLNAVQTLRSAGGAAPQVFGNRTRLLRLQFTVKVEIEFRNPGIANHISSFLPGLVVPCPAPPTAMPASHVTAVTSPCQSVSPTLQQSLGNSSLLLHKAATLPGAPPAGAPALVAQAASPIAATKWSPESPR